MRQHFTRGLHVPECSLRDEEPDDLHSKSQIAGAVPRAARPAGPTPGGLGESNYGLGQAAGQDPRLGAEPVRGALHVVQDPRLQNHPQVFPTRRGRPRALFFLFVPAGGPDELAGTVHSIDMAELDRPCAL